MSKFKVGDIVVVADPTRSFVGIVLKHREVTNVYNIFTNAFGSAVYSAHPEYIYNINEVESAREFINNYFDKQINERKANFKDFEKYDSNAEKLEKYNKLRELITKNCERIVGANIDEFERRLKEICKLKKEIFSIELDGADNIRKHNYNISRSIMTLEANKKALLEKISDKEIEKWLNF